MSVINQMLQDLEKRRAGASEGAALPNQVRPLPPSTPVAPRFLSPAIAIVAIAVVAALLWWWTASSRQAASVVPPPQASAPAQPRIAEQQPAKPAVPPAPRPEVAAQKPVTDKAAHLDLKQLRVSPALGQAAKTPAQETRVQRVTTPVAAAAPTPSVPQATSQPVPDSEPAPKPRAEFAQGKITKVDRPSSPRERADIEYRRATSALGQGRSEEAEEALRAALNEDPTYDGARQTLVGMLVEQKRVDEAKKLLQDYLATKPNHIPFATLLARLQIDRGDNNGAVATVLHTLPYAGDNVDFLGFAAALMQRAGRNTEAIEQYRAALRLRPDSAVWWMGLGMSLQANEQKTDALDAYKRALTSGSLSPELQAFVEQRIKQVSP
jgi:MSHA biogenesis protein MshN